MRVQSVEMKKDVSLAFIVCRQVHLSLSKIYLAPQPEYVKNTGSDFLLLSITCSPSGKTGVFTSTTREGRVFGFMSS